MSCFAILINVVLASALEKLAHKNIIPYRKLLLIVKNFQEKKKVVACAEPLSRGINKPRNTIHKNWISLCENNVLNCKKKFLLILIIFYNNPKQINI